MTRRGFKKTHRGHGSTVGGGSGSGSVGSRVVGGASFDASMVDEVEVLGGAEDESFVSGGDTAGLKGHLGGRD